MKCPSCDSKDVVVLEVKEIPGNKIMRVRGCNNCGDKFRAIETVESRKSTSNKNKGTKRV